MGSNIAVLAKVESRELSNCLKHSLSRIKENSIEN
jgi:hypothetical protein